MLIGGETTVTLPDKHGLGGRNQEFVLAALLASVGVPGMVILSGGTDGEDGPTDAAGAIGDETTWSKVGYGEARRHLQQHDAYRFFKAAGGLLKTGLTQTNVMDVRVVLIG